MTDPFSVANDAFVKMDHVLGRLLLIQVTGSGERESNLKGAKAGDMYTFVETDTVVLDGEIDDMIDSIPMELDGFQFSGETVTGQLLPALRKMEAGKGNGLLLNRLGQKPNQFKTLSWVLQDVTEEDKAIARKYLADKAAREAAAKPKDPFAAAAAE